MVKKPRQERFLAVYPGSFDPVTNGHLDIIRRAAAACPRLIVAVVANPNKRPLFTLPERVALLRDVCKGLDVEVDSFEGLLVDYVRRRRASLIIKGLRIVSDFEYEFSMALLNRRLRGGVDTMFLPASLEYAYISSSSVREVFSLGGNIADFVPPAVLRAMRRRAGPTRTGKRR
ncbi:MAG: pantetheine-phosphate adenylyltransferase [Candidatus Eremiobacteraeota bacterium]|nr:pantetheine-phosphate adenylyltransferase [Candidatus Eremiobacteraeota bacterium]MBV8459252.1 pantetheine-phosphate adenylyltransferase [Candidatus Eremiobacteraeota bacterium]MBV8596759.1 pantetheine-phosphate adenylyltransferase [Candidatus Eremiobacteraeota bacterium]MBV8668508.1 pantetheine-phosphate adenylyltransferase [Candidatus Eremiobacteraeota bacterium]MBV8670413.1 pantetheine-phosphate adenylyltransferase [Candidatus Eremiobacteraeota bacterium]